MRYEAFSRSGKANKRIEQERRRSVGTVLVINAVFWLLGGADFVVKVAARDPKPLAEALYRIDASKSTFMVRALSGGLLWFKGHDHLIAIRDFEGEVRLTPGAISPASMRITVKTNSLVETRDVFTEQEKQIINKELHEIVLLPEKYPEITFRSTNVVGTLRPGGAFEAEIEGDLTMHGITRRIVILAEVSLVGNDLRAKGEFTIDRSDFKVKATSAFHGLVRVRDKLKLTFDIAATGGPT